jgi:ATP-dependent Clp protease ATP-binding subunit ClpA
MPKINVYLPDDLADAVRAARLPVSAVCQRALEDALQKATAAAESARALEAAGEDDLPAGTRATPRLRKTVQLAYAAARERGVNYVGTEHLLLGILDEGGNLALRVIEALDVEPDDLRRELDALIAQHQAGPGPGGDPKLTALAARSLELAVHEAMRLFHNYLGCEHLLLGLVEEEEGLGGRALRTMGVDKTVARRAVVSALSGFVQARREFAAPPAAPSGDQVTREILERLTAIERKLGT